MSAVLAAEAGAHAAGVDVVALLVGLFLLIANGYFVAAEIALLAARRTRVEELAESGDPRAQSALAALQELSVTFSGAQLGITAASIGLGAIAEPAVVGVVAAALAPVGLPEATVGGVAFAVGLAIVVFLHMVVGEMTPKNLALADAERIAMRVARSFRLYVVVLRPVILLFNGLANLLVRMVGVRPVDEHRLVHTPEELALALRESGRAGVVAAQDARVMSAALGLASIDAEAAMTPRVDIVAVSTASSPQDVLDRASETGLTRLPVYHEDLDQVVGIVHVKDLLVRHDELRDTSVAELARPLPAVPESRDLDRLLAEMRAGRHHAVLVVDEYGGTAGLVTLEDVLEELVGEIEDEFDAPTRDAARRRGVWTVDGLTRVDELERLTGLRLRTAGSETVNGAMTERLGRLLRRGDVVETDDGWRLGVVRLRGRRAGQVEVRAPSGREGDGRRRDGRERAPSG